MECTENRTIPGVASHVESKGPMEQTTVKIESQQAAGQLGKPVGTYITQQWHPDLFMDTPLRDEAAAFAAEALKNLLPKKITHALVVGLGNRRITADALGPRVAERVLVTRHIRLAAPDWLDPRFGTVSAVAPGVMGETGVETADVIRAIAAEVRPDVVICVDALASRRTARIACTLQMADSGIQPGGGLGSPRAELCEKTLGMPVISIGVPMVVYAKTIAQDVFEAMTDIGGDLPQHVEETAESAFGDLVVTPKEIDRLIEEAASLIADGINLALHPAVPLGTLRGMVM